MKATSSFEPEIRIESAAVAAGIVHGAYAPSVKVAPAKEMIPFAVVAKPDPVIPKVPPTKLILPLLLAMKVPVFVKAATPEKRRSPPLDSTLPVFVNEMPEKRVVAEEWVRVPAFRSCPPVHCAAAFAANFAPAAFATVAPESTLTIAPDQVRAPWFSNVRVSARRTVPEPLIVTPPTAVVRPLPPRMPPVSVVKPLTTRSAAPPSDPPLRSRSESIWEASEVDARASDPPVIVRVFLLKRLPTRVVPLRKLVPPANAYGL